MVAKLDIRNKSIVYYIILHAGLGLVVSLFASAAFYWQMLIIVYGLHRIIRSRNKNNEAGLWSAYFAGMEVFLRMTSQSLFWEFGKYGVILFLVIGLLFNTRKLTTIYMIYFLLLVPSIFVGAYVDFAEAKDMISFNLSGPLCLAVSCLYFFNRKISTAQLLVMFRMLTLPVISMVVYLLLTSPDLSSVDFGSGSNFTASGGYGPNQVSLILGISIFMIVIFRFLGTSFSGIKWLDYSMAAIILFRALVTFSRGGVFGAALALAVFLIFRIQGGVKGKQVFNYVLISIVITAVGFFVWDYTNTVTNNALQYRYEGVNQQTGKEKEYTTGRILVITRDFLVFQNNLLLGVGPGKAKDEGSELGVQGIPAHTEWTRMLAEHGLFGVAALLILFVAPIVHIFGLSKNTRPLLFALFVLALFSMFHAAMRLSIISYLYGWALLIPVGEKKSIMKSKPTNNEQLVTNN